MCNSGTKNNIYTHKSSQIAPKRPLLEIAPLPPPGGGGGGRDPLGNTDLRYINNSSNYHLRFYFDFENTLVLK